MTIAAMLPAVSTDGCRCRQRVIMPVREENNQRPAAMKKSVKTKRLTAEFNSADLTVWPFFLASCRLLGVASSVFSASAKSCRSSLLYGFTGGQAGFEGFDAVCRKPLSQPVQGKERLYR